MEPANVTEAKDIGMFVEIRRFSNKARGLMEKPNRHNFDPMPARSQRWRPVANACDGTSHSVDRRLAQTKVLGHGGGLHWDRAKKTLEVKSVV
jgi:hypothetical protein